MEDSSQEHFDEPKVSAIRLPNINAHKLSIPDALKKSGSNNFGAGDYKIMKHNLSNHSIGIENTNNNTQYSKNMLKNKITIRKDQFKELKKNYISPYAQKIISNNLKIA